MYTFPTITLPATALPDKALSLMGGPVLIGGAAIQPPKKRGRKAAPVNEEAEDSKIYRLKQKPEYRRYEDLAKALNKKVAEVKKAVERARKREARKPTT